MAKKRAGRKKSQTKAAKSKNKQTWAVLLFAVGLLLAALTLISGDRLWNKFHSLIFGMLGITSYFLAPLCIYISIAFAKDKPVDVVKTKLWQSGILIVLISGAIEVFGGLPKVEGLGRIIVELYREGVQKKGGGVIGIITAGPLSFIDSSPGPQIIIVLALFVFFMLVTGSTLMSLYQSIKKSAGNVGDAYSSGREKFKQKQQEQSVTDEFKYVIPEGDEDVTAYQQADNEKTTERQRVAENVARIMPKFDIDIDISGDKAPEELEKEQKDDRPIEPTMKDLAGVNINDPDDPFATFGIDQPVEYITTPSYKVPENKQDSITEEIPKPRPHPLGEEIDRAGQQEVTQVIQDYLDRIKTSEDIEPPAPVVQPEPEEFQEIELETFKINTNFDEEVDTESEEQENQEVENIEEKPEISELPQDVMPVEIAQPRPKEVQKPQTEKKVFDNSVIAPPPKDVKEKALEKTSSGYKLPPIRLLEEVESTVIDQDLNDELQENAETLVETLESFGVKTKVIDIARGPAVTRYELQPSAGVKISRITGLADDIALNLAAAGIRIEAPIPNKAAVGIEVPNKSISIVRIREIIESSTFKDSKSKISMALGKDITGNIKVADISKMPHMLIAGATGSGKSVCINSLIMSILYKYSPDEVKMLMIDPKVVELGVYNGIPHLLVPVVTDPNKAAGALTWAVNEMLKRYKTFAANGVRDIDGYNRAAKESDELEEMAQIVIIIDELSDLMMATPTEVEDAICRLAQMARAAGMHLVIATQRPSVDVITGLIKANIPSRVAFAVSSQVDSRTILDMGGAEKLLGRGDMLFYPVGASKPMRVQGCFVTDKEVENVVDFIKKSQTADYDETIVEEIDRLALEDQDVSSPLEADFDDEDEYMPFAIECIVEAGQASTSLLQRRLRIGYARAARIMDQLEARGIVGPPEGSKARELRIDKERYVEMKLSGEDQPGGVSEPEGEQLESE